LLVAAIGVSCRAKPQRGRMIILGFDGLDWNLVQPGIDRGDYPNLRRLQQEGAWGRLQSIRPSISSIIWTSIATGVTMIKHGILSWTFMKKKGIQVPYNYSEIREPMLWEILNSAGKRSVVINWFNTYPPERINGLIVSDFARRIIQVKDPKRVADTVFPRALLGRLAAAVDRNLQRVQDRMGLPDYRKLALDRGLDPARIPLIGGFGIFMLHEEMLARLSWDIFEHAHFDLFARYSRFPDVVCHLLTDFLPKVAIAEAGRSITLGQKPPQALSERLQQRYEELCRPVHAWVDQQIGRYLERMGAHDWLLVVSDHGFALGAAGYNHDLPEWMEPEAGVFALKGPGVRQGLRNDRLTVYDVAPTVLYLLDLPVGRKMDGHVAREILTSLRPVRFRSYYRRSFVRKHHREFDQSTLEDLRTLGYIQ
jgi:predicted AlkP superfamily phosphohydrolase/phosphomutase